MQRVLVEITGSKIRETKGLEGTLGIMYPDNDTLANMIRLGPDAKKIHSYGGYIRCDEVEYKAVRDTTFDDFRKEVF